MSTIEIDGFLSSDVQRYVDECRRRYATWFELIQRINRLGQSLLTEVRIDRTNLQQSMASLLYVRVLSHAQGAVLLIERCMPTQGEVLCRASLEALFGLMAVIQQAGTAQLLVRGDRHHQLKLLKAALRRSDNLGADAQQKAALLLRDIKDDLGRDPGPEMTTQSLAERGGLVALYDSAYKILSLSVHSNLRDLEGQLSLDQDGNPISIGWGPNLEGLDESLMLLADTLIRATTAICGFFNLGHEEELQAIRSNYAPLAANMVERMSNHSA